MNQALARLIAGHVFLHACMAGMRMAAPLLALRLAQALFRPSKIAFECPNCALMRHEPDAVHCKACGNLLRIPDEGRD